MRVLWSWLSELVELDRSPQEVAEQLSAAGIEVDDIERLGPEFSNVVTARLLEVTAHTNADKLSMCRVFDGHEERIVVCGASNMKAGDGVALAKHKARLPGGVVKRGKIRGAKSDGMLCSEAELEIGDDADGILILPGDVELGVPLDRYLGLDDCVIVLDLTPDRADCLGMVGVAREVATISGCPLKGVARMGAWWEPVEPGPAAATAGAGDQAVDIELQDPVGCPRYTGIVVQGVQIGPSPSWMVQRLKAAGAGVHNNVVDATNYMCRLLGQPLHAFDLRFLRGGKVIVRRAREGERFRALDGTEHVLGGEDVAICDAEGPVALGGVIGGEGSMVADDTTDLLLEAAWFEPTFIRRTSARKGVKTESSDRFARGVDPHGTAAANGLLAELIVEIAGGRVLGPVADCYPQPWAPGSIRLATTKLNGLLGTQFSTDEAVELLRQEGMRVTSGADELDAQAPPWRVDMEQDVDLIEEVARLYHYDNIPITLPVAAREPVRRTDLLERAAREYLAGQGFSELALMSFCGEDELRRFGLGDEDIARCVRLSNPLGQDTALLLPSLLPSMVRHAGASSRRTAELRTFQLRRTFELGESETGVRETLSLAALWMGSNRAASWDCKPLPADFFDLKGVLEGLLERFRVGGVRAERHDAPPAYLEPGQVAALMRGRDRVGVLGRLAPQIAARYELASPAYVFEIAFGKLVSKAPSLRYVAPSEYPSAQRDVALLTDSSVSADTLLSTVRKAKPGHLVSVGVFDVYEGEELGENKRSVAIRLVFQSPASTLSGDEVDAAFTRVLDRFRELPGVTVREG